MHWSSLHDRIKPVSSKSTSKSNNLDPTKVTEIEARVKDCASLESLTKTADHQKLSVGINKNSILLQYEESCITQGFANQVTTAIQSKMPPTISYPLHHRPIADCKMKPSTSLYY